MTKTIVINDLHLGVRRSGGTTPATAAELRKYCHDKHAGLLALAADGDTVIVNGDLTDTYDTDLSEAIEVYAVAASWLRSQPHSELIWALGNHDLSKDSSKLGTVQFVGRLLKAQFPEQFHLVDKPLAVTPEIYVIPHVANQDLFDLELDRIPDSAKVVLLHCNYDNAFAGQADHSLNLPRDKAKALTKAGKILVLGHEHQGRTLMGDKVIIVGNQFPTSVSDCMRHGDGQQDGTKYALLINNDDLEDMELVPTWSVRDVVGGFKEIDWRNLDRIEDEQRLFIRVTGTADAAEAADVIKAISSLRQRSAAFVVTNAVKIDAVEGDEEIEASIEEIKSVSVIDILLGMLDEDQQACVRKLMEEEEE